MTAFGVGANPFKLLLDRSHPRLLGLLLLLQALVFLFQPRGVVPFPWDTAATIEFQYPTGDVVQKVAIMSDGYHGSFVFVQETLQPGNGFCIQMVGWLVQQQHVWFRQQQFAQCNPALFTARQFADICIPWRQAQCIGRNLKGAIGVVAIAGL